MSNERERLVKMLEAWAEARDEDARLSDPLGKLRDETIRIARDLRRAAALLREPRNSPEIPDSSPREAPAAEPHDDEVGAAARWLFGEVYPVNEWPLQEPSVQGFWKAKARRLFVALRVAAPAAERIGPDALIRSVQIGFRMGFRAAAERAAWDYEDAVEDAAFAEYIAEVMATPDPADQEP